LVGESKSRADELLVLAPDEAAEIGQFDSGDIQIGRDDVHDVDLFVAEPRPAAVRRHRDRTFA